MEESKNCLLSHHLTVVKYSKQQHGRVSNQLLLIHAGLMTRFSPYLKEIILRKIKEEIKACLSISNNSVL
jgi:hypothetical protein